MLSICKNIVILNILFKKKSALMTKCRYFILIQHKLGIKLNYLSIATNAQAHPKSAL